MTGRAFGLLFTLRLPVANEREDQEGAQGEKDDQAPTEVQPSWPHLGFITLVAHGRVACFDSFFTFVHSL